MPEKTILFIGNHLSIKGQNLSVSEELSMHLVDSGCNSILTSSKRNQIFRLLDMVKTIICKRRKYSIAEVDLFSGNAFIWGFLCALVVKMIRKPLILVLHGGNLPFYAKRHRSLVKTILGWSDLVVAPSEYLKESLSFFRNDIRVIPNGLNIRNYQVVNRKGITPSLVWLRAFHKIYNPLMAVQVIDILQKEYPTAHLIMIGPDKRDGSLQKVTDLIRDLQLEDFIEVHGKVAKQDVPAWLTKEDIFINTTNIDNTPISVMEAMACGLCVVSTNVGGLPYLIENNRNGILTSPENPGEMAEVIKNLVRNPSFAAEIAQNARKTAETKDWAKIIPMWEEVFKSFL
jgi:glycosyltransferase involved in cell wall biosynthesis